jgi:hypothetical protein
MLIGGIYHASITRAIMVIHTICEQRPLHNGEAVVFFCARVLTCAVGLWHHNILSHHA